MSARHKSSTSKKKLSDSGRGTIRKVVLAYSGGLDTSVILQWLREEYQCQVIAFCADLGQGEDLKAVKKKAIEVGASKVYVEDLQKYSSKIMCSQCFEQMPSTKDTICWAPPLLVR